MQSHTPRITISELLAMRNQKKKHRKESYDQILKKIHNRMRTVAAMSALNCFYEIPPVIMGLPLYNLADATEFVVTTLRGSGFMVQTVPNHPGVIYISWNPQELHPRRAIK